MGLGIGQAAHSCWRWGTVGPCPTYLCWAASAIAFISLVMILTPRIGPDAAARGRSVAQYSLALLALASLGLALFVPSGCLTICMRVNETAAARDVHDFVPLQAAYASANGGYYDTLECLAAPERCIPGYPSGGQSLLEPWAASSARRGYRFALKLGPLAQLKEPSEFSASSRVSFAYTAVPIAAGQTGSRSFCADDRGIICSTPPGHADTIPVIDGRCQCREL